MSVSAHRRIFRAVDVLICAALLISGACHHQARSTAPQPTGYGRSFSGVDVVPTGHGAFVIRIHSAMIGAGEPLYVIDGTPIMIPANRGIDWFKPEDIVAIKVLKYPHELAEYGTRGVNGVVVITTKQGRAPSR